MPDPTMLPPPKVFRSVEDLLEYAKPAQLDNVVLLSERQSDGAFTLLVSGEMPMATVNFLLDRAKGIVVWGQGRG